MHAHCSIKLIYNRCSFPVIFQILTFTSGIWVIPISSQTCGCSMPLEFVAVTALVGNGRVRLEDFPKWVVIAPSDWKG